MRVRRYRNLARGQLAARQNLLVLSDFTRGYGPHKAPLQIAILDALVDGAATSADVAQRTGASPRAVDLAVGWAAGQSLLTRLPLPDGELLTLTQAGLAHIAWERRMRAVVGPDGEIDIAGISRDYAATQQAMRSGQAAELERSQAHLLVDDAERDAAIASLREHYAEGALDDAELDRRTTVALSAKTRGELRGALEALELPASAATQSAGPLLPNIDIAAAYKIYRLLGTLVFITVLVVALTSFLS